MSAEFLTVTCPGCGARSDKVPARLAGRAVRCPRCSRTFPVEAPPVPTDLEAPLSTVYEGSAPPPTAPEAAPPPTEKARAAEWQMGDVLLGLYEVTGVLGQGGMGRVYKVRHRSWELDLAAKVPLPSALEAAGGADLFEHEAETWVNLGLHPHIVACHYVRRLDGLPVVFAEFVDGGSLHNWIKDNRLTTVEAILDVAIQFAWGLHHAHEQGLVHLDVKPANLMLSADGIAKVTDFGLARARTAGQKPLALAGGGSQTLTVEGALGGTPAYLSPEHTSGLALTRRTDLWAWALSVLEMFEGLRTWDYGAAAAEVLEEYLGATPTQGMPPVPAPVAELLRQCFRENPDLRPHTLMDAAEALLSAYASQTGKPYPRQAPRAGRGTPDSLNNRAVSLLDLGREAEAASLWKRALEAQPHHIEATYNQALTGWIEGRWDDEEMLRRMGEARTTHAAVPRIHHLLGRLHLALGDPARAIQSLDQASRLGPPGVDLDRDRGLAALAAAPSDPLLFRRASECFDRALKAGSQEPVDVAGFATALLRAGEEEKARYFYQLAVAQKSDLPPDVESAERAYLPMGEAAVSLKGLTGAASALAVSPDGALVLAGSGKEVRAWDAHGVPVRALASEEATARALAVTPDGRFLVWAGENAPIQVWDLFSGRPVRSFKKQTGFTTALALSADGRHALAGGSDRLVRLWEIASGECARVMEGHKEAVTAVAIGRTRAVSGSRDGTVRIWDLADGRCLGVLEGQEGRVLAVALSEEDARVVSAGEDRTVRDWGLLSRELVHIYAGHVQPVTTLVLSPDGVLFSGSVDCTVRAWELRRERLVSVARLEAAVSALVLGTDGTLWAASGSTVTGLRLLARPRLPSYALARPVSAVEVERQETRFASYLEEARRLLAQGDYARALELARTARSIPGYDRSEAAVALWDEIGAALPRQGLRSAWEEARLEGHETQALAVTVSPDGARAVSGGMDAAMRVWDLRARQPTGNLAGHQAAVTAVAFSRDSRRLASASWDRTVRLWDPAAGRLLRTLTGHEEYVTGVDFAPDGRYLVSGSWDQTVRLWPVAGGEPAVLAGHAANVAAVAFSPDGRYVVSGAWDATVRAWDAASGDCACAFEGHEGNVTAVAVSPSGRQVASGGQDATVRVWDPRTRRSVRVLTGHQGEVTALAFSPDGRYLASASRDETVRVFDVQKGSCERSLPHPAPVLGLALLPAGNALLSAGADGALRSWHLDWEPESIRPPAWDEKARPFLETFVSVRLKPETVRERVAAWSEADVDALVADLHHRGFGGVRRETVVGKLKTLTTSAQPPPSFWDEVRRAAPKVRAAPVREIRWGRWAGRLALAALLALGMWVGIRSWMKPTVELRVVPYMARTVKKEVDLIDLAAFRDACEGGYETYRDLARAREASGPTLMCLSSFKSRATVSDFLAEAPLTDPDDRLRNIRVFRNAVSLMVGLGEAAVEPLCSRLADPRHEVRRVAAVSLAAMAAPTATACIQASLAQDSALVRTSAASILRVLLANGQLGAAEGWGLVQGLLTDADPGVRIEALRALAMFSPELATEAASPLTGDPDPAVAKAATDAIEHIKAIRKIDLLRAGS